jgi:two-component system CheB/CheR fusion protein
MMMRPAEPAGSYGDEKVLLCSVLDALPDPVFIMAPRRDAAGAIVDFEYRFANAAGLRLRGRSREQLLGRGELELFPSLRDLGVMGCFSRVFATGESEHCEIPCSDAGTAGAFDFSVVKFGDGLLLEGRDETDRTHPERALGNVTQ